MLRWRARCPPRDPLHPCLKDTRATLCSWGFMHLSRRGSNSGHPCHQGLGSLSRNLQGEGTLVLVAVTLSPPVHLCNLQPAKHHGRQKRDFEGALESNTPVNSLDPSHLFLNCFCPYRLAWSQVTSDHWMLEIVSLGYILQLLATLPPHLPSSPSSFRDPSH